MAWKNLHGGKTNSGPGAKGEPGNTNWRLRLGNTNLGFGPGNINWGPGSGTNAVGQWQEPEVGKYQYPPEKRIWWKLKFLKKKKKNKKNFRQKVNLVLTLTLYWH